MRIITGKDAIFYTDSYDVVLVGTSVYNMLTNGFQSKIRFKYPNVRDANDRTGYGDLRKLGTRLTVDCGSTQVSLMYVSKFPNSRRVFVDYDALRNALLTARKEFNGKRIMTTVVGSTPFDGNGDKETCLSIISDCMNGVDIDVYDYEQVPRLVELEHYRKMLSGKRQTEPEKYDRMKSEWDKLMARIYLQSQK